MTKQQYELDAAFREAGLTAVLGIGSTPGITNLLARVAVDQLDRVERLDVRIGSGDFRPNSAPFVPPYSIRTILDECTLEPMVYRNGSWSAVAPDEWAGAVDFSAPIGVGDGDVYAALGGGALPGLIPREGAQACLVQDRFPREFLQQMKLLVDLGLGGTEPVEARGPERGQPARVAPRETLGGAAGAARARRQASQTTATCCGWWRRARATGSGCAGRGDGRASRSSRGASVRAIWIPACRWRSRASCWRRARRECAGRTARSWSSIRRIPGRAGDVWHAGERDEYARAELADRAGDFTTEVTENTEGRESER